MIKGPLGERFSPASLTKMPRDPYQIRVAILGTRGIPANYSGFETSVEETSKRFAWSGADVRVYCRRDRVGDRPMDGGGLERVFLPYVPGKFLETITHTAFSVVHLLFHPTDVAQVYGAGNGWFVPILRLMGMRVQFMVDGQDWERAKWGPFAKWFLRKGASVGANASNHTVVDSRSVLEGVDGLWAKARLVYIPYGAKVIERTGEDALERFGVKKEDYFLFVGRFVPEKGVHTLVSAFEMARVDRSLVLVGGGSYTPEYEKSLRSTTCDRVVFAGFVYGSDYEQLLTNAYAYIQPSELEGTSPSLLAAMGAGCAVLVSNIPENRETASTAAAYFTSGDVAALKLAIEALDGDPSRVQEMRKGAKDRVLQEYSWDVVSQGMLNLMMDR